jgi:hypothetical protein
VPKGCRSGCFNAVFLLVLVAGAGVAWVGWGDEMAEAAQRALGMGDGAAGPVPSPQLARATLERFDALREGSAPEGRLILGGAELSSVVRYSLPGYLPDGVHEPTVDFRGQEMLLSARVAVSSFPDLPALGEVLGLLPDTVDIEMAGSLLSFDGGRTALMVRKVEASRIPLPGRVVPGILGALGRTEVEGLPDNAMAIRLPAGIGRAFVEDDHLVLVAEG